MWKGVFSRGEHFFGLLIQASRNVRTGAERLAGLETDEENPQEAARAIKELERRGDELTREIIRKLDQTFVTPIDREDIHALATAIDDVLDLIDAVADRMALFNVSGHTEASRELARLIRRATGEIFDAVKLLGRKEQSVIHRHCEEINRIEEEADRVNRGALAQLFEEEDDPIAVIKWNVIYGFLEEATDRCEDVADILESIVLKYA